MRHSEYHLDGDVTAPARSRRLIEAWAAGHPRQLEITLALSELVANAVLHAPATTGQHGVSIRFEEHDSCMLVSVRHTGPAFTPVIRHGHSGLALVASSVDRWGITQHGPSVEVWFEVDRTADSSASNPIPASAGIVMPPLATCERNHVIGPTFEIEVVEREPRVRFVVRGEIDIQSAPELDEALSNTDSNTVVLDLSDVTFIDSSGLRILVMARSRIDSSGRSLVLCASDDSAVVRTIRLAGLSADFEVVPNLDGLAE